MKKSLLVVPLILSLFYWTGCKKCYHCQDTCMKCTLVDSIASVTQIICSDDTNIGNEYQFAQAIAQDSAMGYICVATASVYSQDYCVNKPGDSSSQAYWNKGGRAPCKPQ